MAHLAAQAQGRDAGEESHFDVRVRPKSTVYCYRVSIVDVDTRATYTQNETDPALRALLWEANRGLLEVAGKELGGFFDGVCYAYNGFDMLYTNLPLKIEEDPKGGQQLIVDLNDTDEEESLLPSGYGIIPQMDLASYPEIVRNFIGHPSLIVTFTRDRDIDISASGDALGPGGKALNEEVRKFLSSLMVESAVKPMTDPVYYALDMNRIFATPTPEHQVDGAITLRTGLLFEPNRKSTSLAACLQYTPFYTEQSLEEALQAFPGSEEGFNSFMNLFRGVRCYMQYDQTRSFVIDGWTEEPIRDTMLADQNGTPFPMTDAFQEDYEDLDVNRRGLRVREAWPLVFAGPRPVVNYDAYPVEALCIMPHQRVPESQMPEDLDRMIKSRVHAFDRDEPRQDALDRHLQEVMFSESARRTLGAFGVAVVPPVQH